MEYRLNKYISASGYCSRREADRFIESGNVTVNGKRAEIGARILPGQKVKVNGNLIESSIQPTYIAFNKPVGIVSTTDPAEKDNIVNFIRHEQRIFPIGRLDKDSQGLILLTNDGDIVNKILRAGNNHKKEYLVTVNKPITKDFLTRMAQGVPVLDRVTRKCEVEEINPYLFKVTLIQGLNRQIRRMCEYLDYEVLKLERTQVMNINLGKLGQGNWRDLTPAELEGLFDLLDKSENAAERSMSKKKAAEAVLADKPKSSSKPKVAREDGEVLKRKEVKDKVSAPKSDRGEDKTKAKSKSAAKKKEGTGLRVGKQRPEKLKKAKMSDLEKYRYKKAKKKD